MSEFWQYLPSHLDPVILRLGSFRLQWYGMMYIAAFTVTYLLAKHRCRTEGGRFAYSLDFQKDILTWAFVGVLLGGRLGYVLFYHFGYYLSHPLEIIIPFNLETGAFTGISGMSYHGGLTGVFVATLLFSRRRQASWWNLADLYGPLIPLGYTCGRLGNFINGELYGRVTTSPVGMYFPSAPTGELRHPSQLYEAAFEGVFCFALLWSLRKVKLAEGSMAALYLISYGTVRFFIEFFRQPDAHLGLVVGSFSMGQVLCAVMISAGVALLWVAHRRPAARPV